LGAWRVDMDSPLHQRQRPAGPIVAIRPRPGSGYGQAAALSMAKRDHGKMEIVFWELLANSCRS